MTPQRANDRFGINADDVLIEDISASKPWKAAPAFATWTCYVLDGKIKRRLMQGDIFECCQWRAKLARLNSPDA